MRRRAWSLLLVVALAWAGAPLPAASTGPLGKLVWTDASSGSAKVKFHVFVPTELDSRYPLVRSGTFQYEGADLAASDPFAFMHPVFDYTGVRLLFSSGKAVEPAAGGGSPGQPTTEIHKFKQGQIFAPRGAGWSYTCLPACFHQTDLAFYGTWDVATGFTWSVKPIDGGGGASPQTELDGALWPVVSYEDTKIAFARRLAAPAPSAETPIAVGLFIADLDASGTVSNVQSVTPDLLEPFPLSDVNGDGGALFAGPIRVGRPAWIPGGEALVVPIQDCRWKTTNSTWNLWRVEARAGATPTILTNEGEADDFWPSVSSDGKWVAHVRKSLTSEDCKVVVTSLDSPSSTPIEPEGLGTANLWPCFDQDNDPPNLEVRLTPSDSGKPTLIRLVDLEPDVWTGGTCKDTFELSFSGFNFHEDMSTEKAAGTTMTLEWPKSDYPPKLYVNLSTKGALARAPHQNYTDFTGTIGSEERTVGGRAIDAFFIRESVRLKIEVLAKDNRFLRLDSGDDMDPLVFKWTSVAANYDDTTWESTTSSAQGRNVDPPYLPRLNKERIDANYPGVSWWVEDADGNLVSGTDGAFTHIFRSPTYPADKYPEYNANRPFRLRIVAQDLWLNRTDVTIPIFVWDTKASVNALEFGTKRTK